MKKFIIISVALLVFRGMIFAEKDVNISLKGSPKSTVMVSNISGSLTCKGWDKNEIKVTGTIEDDVKEIETKERGNQVEIRVVLPKHKNQINGSAYLTIMVPNDAALELSTVSADITVEDLKSSFLNVSTVSGEVVAEGKFLEANIRTVSGDVDLRGYCEDMKVQTVSGDVESREMIDMSVFTGQTVSGEFELNFDVIEKLSLNTTSGDVDFSVSDLEDSRVTVKSLSGEIRAAFPDDVDAYFNLSTMSGSVSDRLFNNKPTKKKYGPGENLSFSNKKGSAKISIDSFSGDVEILNKR